MADPEHHQPAGEHHPFAFDRRFVRLLGLGGVREATAGVWVAGDRLTATFGRLRAEIDLANIAAAQRTGPYRWFKAIGPRLSLADHGLTFGTTTEAGVCLLFHEPIAPVIGPWRHPGLTLTVADPDALVEALGRPGDGVSQ